ncbi:MAG: hypothetical protein JKX85_15685 [Phycisphaeraceae bacterium]|nr:hypothetical protein [Phycisphaeraceae bacterium]
MANSFVEYSSNGGISFVFNKGYLAKSDVHVYVEEVETTDFTWTDDSTILLGFVPQSNPFAVRIQRETSIDARLVTWTDGGSVAAPAHNKDSLQMFYVTQETAERVLRFDKLDGKYDAETRIIKNLADAVANTDATTLQQVTALINALALSQGNMPLSGTINNMLVSDGTNWAVKTDSQARGTLGLGTSAIVDTGTINAAHVVVNQNLWDYVSTKEIPTGVLAPYGGIAAPAGWFMCDGTVTMGYSGSNASYASFDSAGVSASNIQALFAILWDTEGILEWNGTSLVPGVKGASAIDDWIALKVVAVPDMRGRTPVGAGTGAGLTARTAGEVIGEEDHLLTESEMPSHNHTMAYPLVRNDGGTISGDWTVLDAVANNLANEIGNTGGDVSHNNMQPSKVMNWIIKR